MNQSPKRRGTTDERPVQAVTLSLNELEAALSPVPNPIAAHLKSGKRILFVNKAARRELDLRPGTSVLELQRFKRSRRVRYETAIGEIIVSFLGAKITPTTAAHDGLLRLVDSAGDVIFRSDPEGYFTFMNRTGIQLLGFPASETIGMHFTEVVAPEYQQKALEVFIGYRESRESHHYYEFPVVLKDGTTRWVGQKTRTIVENGELVGFEGVARDITNRIQAESALNESRERLRNIVAAAPIALMTLDRGGLITFASGEAILDAGASPAELEGKYLSDVITTVDIDQHLKALSRGEVTYAEIEGANGRTWEARFAPVTDESGQPAGGIVVGVDVTARRKAESVKRRAEERFYKSFHSSSVPSCIASFPDARVIEVNASFSKLTGLQANELHNEPISDLGIFGSPGQFGKILNEIKKAGLIRQHECELQNKQGEMRQVLLSAEQFDLQDQKCFVIDLIDETAQRAFQSDLIAAKERAEEMAKLKTAFLANMSHEIRTPLTSILGFASMLSSEVSGDHKEFVDLIERSGKRLMETLNSVLDLAQLEARQMSTRPENIDIATEVKQAMALLQPVILEKGLKLNESYVEDAMTVCVDRACLHRVLNNLMSNAIKFTPSGVIEVCVVREEASALVHISDTGIGMDAEFMPVMFEEFRQGSDGLARTHEGAGLGLTISKRLVEYFGGAIEVKSEKGKGSQFSIRFPLITDQGIVVDRTETKPKVLVVEDNPETRALVRKLLRRNCDIHEAANSEEALAQASTNAFDVVLMDINLGDGPNGLDVLKEIKKIAGYERTPVIAMTAYGLPGDEDRFLGEGFSFYLGKPFDVARLRSAVSELIIN